MASQFIDALMDGLRDLVNSDLGEIVSWTHGIVTTQVRVVWSQGESVQGAVAGAGAKVLVPAADLPSPPQDGDTVTVGGETWRVVEVLPSNRTGFMSCYLRRV